MTMAREATPVLSGAIPSLELFMSRWELLASKYPNLAPFINAGLVKAREYYAKMDSTRAYVISLGKVISTLLCGTASLTNPCL
jgi:hypothetical protein